MNPGINTHVWSTLNVDERDCKCILGWGYLHSHRLFRDEQTGTPPPPPMQHHHRKPGRWRRNLMVPVGTLDLETFLPIIRWTSIKGVTRREAETDVFYVMCWIIYWNLWKLDELKNKWKGAHYQTRVKVTLFTLCSLWWHERLVLFKSGTKFTSKLIKI